MRCDVIVLDGNAKNRRAVCAAALAGCSYSPTLRRTLRHTCTKTPAFKHCFCLHHCEAPGADRSHTVSWLESSNIFSFVWLQRRCLGLCSRLQDVEILQHKSINDGQQLMVLLQETTEPRREAWVLDSAVPDTVLSKYLRQVGAEKLKLRKRTHEPQPSDTAGPSPAPPLLQAQVEPVAELEQCSDPADLASVACSTHKESSTAQRQLAKSAGMLCVCLSEGLILHMQEIYGCESLSQRYFCIAAVKALLPTLTTVVHDDACHLHKYCARRAAHSQAAAQLSPPHMTFVCDKFHMAGHTDAWCKQTCDPELPSNSALLAGVSFSCGAMSGAPDDGQYVPAMKLMWDEGDRRFDPKYVLGEAGHQFCQSYSVRAAHPEFPYALHCLSLMCALANGARFAIFATAPSPLTLVAVNVNYAQTRKSSMTGHAEALGQELDTVILENAMSKLQQESFEEGAAQVLRRGFSKSNCPPYLKPRIASATVASATPEEWFHRCSADWNQVRNADKLPGDWSGRCWYGLLGNFDEAYDFLLSLGLLSDSNATTREKSKSKVDPYQSAFNKLLQFGSSARATKTAGSYGENPGKTISLGITCNMHPAFYIPMERGELGSHAASTKERFLISTGRPVQPHEDIPADFCLPEGVSPYRWVPLTPEIADLIGVAKEATSPDAAAQEWAEAGLEDEAAAQLTQNAAGEYVPSEDGYLVRLLDDKLTRIRFRRSEAAPNGFEAEWRVANRNFAIPEVCRLRNCIARVATYFAAPHQVITLTSEAESWHLSYQGAMNVQSHVVRDTGDIQAGARFGAAPWQVGVLAALLLVFEIFVGAHSPAALEGRALQVTPGHLQRAYALLQLVQRLKHIALGDTAASPDLPPPQEDVRADDLGALRIPYVPEDFASTQAGAGIPEVGDDEEGDEAAEESPEEHVPELPAPVAVKPLTLQDVRASDFGFGDNGVTVQPDGLHSRNFTDRTVLKQTLLAGKPKITRKEACDKMRSERGQGRKALPKEKWVAVMRAAASQFPDLLRLDGEIFVFENDSRHCSRQGRVPQRPHESLPSKPAGVDCCYGQSS
ncbi:unnamed protein product [Cladocopium goreaui]|uniref:Uncharacterized protein n=1 Tax=Cladocopium goreaui TaxID=2562237 RepID=A0A9P1C7V8_9DINO|nr:unnamed protein product [Cladocopium goreaui]